MSVTATKFDELVRAAFEELPDVYRDACDGLGIRTETRAADDVLKALGIADRAHKLVSRGEWSAEHLVRGLLRDAGRLD